MLRLSVDNAEWLNALVQLQQVTQSSGGASLDPASARELLASLKHPEILVREAGLSLVEALAHQLSTDALVDALLDCSTQTRTAAFARRTFALLGTLAPRLSDSHGVAVTQRLSLILVAYVQGHRSPAKLLGARATENSTAKPGRFEPWPQEPEATGLVCAALAALASYPARGPYLWPLTLKLLRAPDAAVRAEALQTSLALGAAPDALAAALGELIAQLEAANPAAAQREAFTLLGDVFCAPRSAQRTEALVVQLWTHAALSQIAQRAGRSPLLPFVADASFPEPLLLRLRETLNSPVAAVRWHATHLFCARPTFRDLLHDDFAALLQDLDPDMRRAALAAYLSSPDDDRLWVEELRRLQEDPLHQNPSSQALLRAALRAQGFSPRVPGLNAANSPRSRLLLNWIHFDALTLTEWSPACAKFVSQDGEQVVLWDLWQILSDAPFARIEILRAGHRTGDTHRDFALEYRVDDGKTQSLQLRVEEDV